MLNETVKSHLWAISRACAPGLIAAAVLAVVALLIGSTWLLDRSLWIGGGVVVGHYAGQWAVHPRDLVAAVEAWFRRRGGSGADG